MKFSKSLEYISAVSYEASTYHTEQKKQRAGFLIKEILDRFTNKTQSLLKPDRSLWIYAIHSTGMVNLLNSLNVFDVCFCFILSTCLTSLLFKNGPLSFAISLFFLVSDPTIFLKYLIRIVQTR